MNISEGNEWRERPVREQVGRLQGLLGDDKTSAQWRQLDCRLGDCLEEAKLSMTRLAETTAHGLALYLQDGQPKIPQPRGRCVELAATSSEGITSDISESPVSSSAVEEETPSESPFNAAVYSRAPEIDEDVLKRMAENRVDEVERELEALAAVHEREQRKEEEEEEDFPIDGFKLGVGEVEERSSKWACKPHEESDDEDRRRWIFTRTPRVHLKDPNRAADRSTHGLVGRWTIVGTGCHRFSSGELQFVSLMLPTACGRLRLETPSCCWCGIRHYHKFVRPEAPNQDNLKKTITRELQPIAFEMQNDKNAGNYLYDKHYWGYICSPKFEGKTYKEMKDMLKDLLERCEMGEGRCRFKLEPPKPPREHPHDDTLPKRAPRGVPSASDSRHYRPGRTVLVCGISEDLLANRFTRLESGLLAQLAACGSIAITRHSTLSSVPSAWTAMLASTLVLFGCLLMLARLDLSPRRIQSPLYSLLLSAVYLLSRSICSERAERSIAALVEYIGTPSHCTTLFWWGLAILIGVGGTQLTESVHVFGQGSRGTIIVRKLFHLLAVVLFQPVVISDPEFLGFSQFIALGLFIVLEALRVYHTHLKIVKKLSGYLVQYLDGKDPSDGGIIFTHISLLLGLSIPVWFELGYSSEFSVLRASAGILSVGVGDAMAACVGVTVRGPKIPGAERRTIAGLIGFVVSAMGYGLAVMTGGDWAMMWRRSGMAICATAFLECYITSIDNLVLPVYMLALLAF
ncbi:hypothetical protein Pmar_PMAR011564 [Perkinsus marinus ATCC 50983]|uniref:dolichol kinase n=1 Tax=Perkinsus marinus (strain ATCC 50983 / TXsc) TaxID=423536 RepID=C5LC53_PERM5|nr:hypothetical protein Pmar_PMAR011564 [Perkinsus marinus ATCC 50983]EER05536.1 hypothetical protein Pmar_PMAR011564 [Perkinsus marinus ATCC 50983]|eukprot:XP_002773720.1 hypothetical protein Pmar_PMAR011564 [Perkinsus marinus ATCC 50983]